MQPLRFWTSFLLVILSHCPILNGAPTLCQCLGTDLEIAGGNYTLSNLCSNGSILKYVCPEGFYPHPAKKRVCDKGQWHPSPTKTLPVCKKVTCPNPNVLENGFVRPYQPAYYVNDTTNYSCHSDYTFRGSATRVCQANGKWSGGTPICSRNSDHCPDPGTPPGARRQGYIFNIDDKVVYTCDKNLRLIGSKVRVCQDGGYWSGREPECYAHFTYDTPEEVAESFSSSLKTTITMYEESAQFGKKIRLDQGGKIDIYIALDASDSIQEEEFNQAKEIITKLIRKISDYEVSPNYEIIVFATDVAKIIDINVYKKGNAERLTDMLKVLKNYKFDDKGEKSGTNIRKAYEAILQSISFEKAQNKAAFNETQHVIIMFTDGVANMGGDPTPVVENIKDIVYDGNPIKRDKYLDLYAFGVGSDVEKEKIDAWVTKRPNEKHFFILSEMEEVEETFDKMIDESTSVSLCGLYKDLNDLYSKSVMRLTYPWMVKTSVTHEGGTANCVGSLVTPRFILTAAHCLTFAEDANKILLVAPNSKELKLQAEKVIIHPDYDPRKKVAEKIKEFYEYDVALIQLKKGVKISPDIRTICIPCTLETNRALQLSARDATCEKHREVLLNSELVKAHFTINNVDVGQGKNPKKHVLIRQGQEREACIEQAEKILNIDKAISKQMITDNFLCTGGPSKNYIDDVTCKGDSGGPVYVDTNRLIQVGVISWGLEDTCNTGRDREITRDFHVDLFNPNVQEFLKHYLGNEDIDASLTFL